MALHLLIVYFAVLVNLVLSIPPNLIQVFHSAHTDCHSLGAYCKVGCKIQNYKDMEEKPCKMWKWQML